MKIMSIFGTRPEAIKMCPLIKEFQNHPEIESCVCLTGQHRELLDSVMDIFNIKPNYNLDIMRENQSLFTINIDIMSKLELILVKENPNIVLVHGDTTTSFVSALSAFYQKIPVGHIEAGLRTYNKYSPYPEEMNRYLIGKIADIHFAPTIKNKENLLKENITENVFVTGNTIIDSFKYTLKDNYVFNCSKLNDIDYSKFKVILVTAHRRENIGQSLTNICNAIKQIVSSFPDVLVVFPVHPNPAIRKIVFPILSDIKRVLLIDPIDVSDMHNLIYRSYFVMTDSGGLQEEAPSCSVPVLVMRKETERSEGINSGTLKLVGVETDDIFNDAKLLLTDENEYYNMTQSINPYGNGLASKYITKILIDWYNKK